MRVVAMWSIFTVATGWAFNLASLVICRFLFGVGEAGCFPNLTKVITLWFPAFERVQAQGVMWLSARWGGAFTPLLVGWMLATGGEGKAGLGLHYKMGANNFYYNYAKRGNYSFNGAEAAQTGAKINTIAYSYDLSKNTSVGVMVTSLASQANAATLPFYQSNNAFGGNTPAFAGETHKITSFALRQNF